MDNQLVKLYFIKCHNLITKETKDVFIDRFGILSDDVMGKGTPALRLESVFPIPLTESDKDNVVNSIKNAKYREMPDGRRCLPEIITRFGGMNLRDKEVNFKISIYTIERTKEITDTRLVFTEEFAVFGTEGKGKLGRNDTQFKII